MTSDIEPEPAATELEKSLGASHVVRAGDHIYVSGQLATDSSGKLITSERLDHHFDSALSRACYELGRKSHRNADSTVGLVPSRSLFPAFLSCF
jgi:enamine deaminase RidA (YjgF/YER057c/UK114 family)